MDFLPQVLQFLLTGVTIGSIYAMVALGFNIIYNSSDVINLAQGEFVMFGGLSMVLLYGALRLPMPLAFILAVLIVVAVGALFERLAIHPLKDASVVTLIIITVGASILFKGIAQFIWGRDTYGLPSFSGDKPFHLLGATILPQSLWILGIVLGLVVALSLFFGKTLTGKAMRACAVNRAASSLVGINVRLMVLFSFALSAGLGAVAGIIITPIAFMDYERGTGLAIKGFAAAVLGGLGSGAGAVAGGFLLGVLESLGAGLISSGYKDAIALIILLLVLFVRPRGIMGTISGEK